jgi:hypothetical protein
MARLPAQAHLLFLTWKNKFFVSRENSYPTRFVCLFVCFVRNAVVLMSSVKKGPSSTATATATATPTPLFTFSAALSRDCWQVYRIAGFGWRKWRLKCFLVTYSLVLYSCVFDDTREEGLYIMEVLDNRNRERREMRKLTDNSDVQCAIMTIQMYSVCYYRTLMNSVLQLSTHRFSL